MRTKFGLSKNDHLDAIAFIHTIIHLSRYYVKTVKNRYRLPQTVKVYKN